MKLKIIKKVYNMIETMEENFTTKHLDTSTDLNLKSWVSTFL